jgi:hypothetical protein
MKGHGTTINASSTVDLYKQGAVWQNSGKSFITVTMANSRYPPLTFSSRRASLDAWAAYQRGLWHMSKFTPADNELAEKYFQQAIDLDANFGGGLPRPRPSDTQLSQSI